MCMRLRRFTYTVLGKVFLAARDLRKHAGHKTACRAGGAETAVKHPGVLECDALVMDRNWRSLGDPDNPHTSST